MSYYNIKGGLHSAEIRLIQRALREHLQTATKHLAAVRRGPMKKESEIPQAQDAIDALIRLSNRLRRELEPADAIRRLLIDIDAKADADKGWPAPAKLTCHTCRKQVPHNHQGPCPACGAPREQIWI